MTGSSPNEYSEPISLLISLGYNEIDREWIEYADLGITSEHIPELIRLIQDIEAYWSDEADDDEVWAPIHTWRALGQLRAEEAISPLIKLLDQNEDLDSDWIGEEIPDVLGMIGPAAIPALETYLGDPGRKLLASISVVSSFVKIEKQHPGSREACVAALQAALEEYIKNDPDFNGFIISYRADLKAVEAAPLVERAFEADSVEVSIQGDYEDFQVAVGLLEERLTQAPNYFWLSNQKAILKAEKKSLRQLEQRERQQEKKEKRKRKQAKKARRRKKK